MHRKTSFEAIGAETSLLSNVRGFATINNILLSNRLNIRDCFIRGNQEQYAFISIQVIEQIQTSVVFAVSHSDSKICVNNFFLRLSVKALIILLECDDPAFATADNKDPFYHGLFHWISEKIKDILSPFSTFPLEGLSVGKWSNMIAQVRMRHSTTTYNFRFSFGTLLNFQRPSLSSPSHELRLFWSVRETIMGAWRQ